MWNLTAVSLALAPAVAQSGPAALKDVSMSRTAHVAITLDQRLTSAMTDEEKKARRRESQRRRRAENPGLAAKQAAQWRAKSPEKFAAIRARYQEKNAAKVAERAKQYRALFPEKAKLAVVRWVKENPDKKRIHNQNRDRRIKELGGKLSLDIVEKLMRLQKGKCACCKCLLSASGYSMDHIEPLAAGGKHEDRNIQLLCRSCNSKKHSKNPIDFMQENGFLL